VDAIIGAAFKGAHMRIVGPTAILLLALAGPADAGGEWRGDAATGYGDSGPSFYARGCYWRRAVRYCSSYCYQEINGNRYCNQRESEAVPQGDPYRAERPTVEDVYRAPRGYR
jgi:hypothetical protein